VSVLRPRTRLVYCRVSEDEFARVSTFCETAGARSVSDVFRSALTRLLEAEDEDRDAGSEKLVLQRLEGIDRMIRELNTKLLELTNRLGGVTERSDDPVRLPNANSEEDPIH